MIKNYLKNFEKYSILISSLLIILGIFLLVQPLKSLEVAIIFFAVCSSFVTMFWMFFAVIMIINGISSFFSYFMLNSAERLFSLELVTGIVTILTGTLMYLYRADLISVFPVILGIWIIASNLIKMQLSINLSVFKESNWFLLLIMQILMVILGVVLITNPFSSMIALATLAGSFLIISETVSLIESIYILIKIKNL